MYRPTTAQSASKPNHILTLEDKCIAKTNDVMPIRSCLTALRCEISTISHHYSVVLVWLSEF